MNFEMFGNEMMGEPIINFLDNEFLLSHFKPKHCKHEVGMLQILSKVFAYTEMGQLMCHGEVIPVPASLDLSHMNYTIGHRDGMRERSP